MDHAAPRESGSSLNDGRSTNKIHRVNCFVVISGCSSGGKSTLLAELGRRGYAVVEEPGRRIVKDALAGDGLALPWVDATAFLRRAVAMALADRRVGKRVGRLGFLR